MSSSDEIHISESQNISTVVSKFTCRYVRTCAMHGSLVHGSVLSSGAIDAARHIIQKVCILNALMRVNLAVPVTRPPVGVQFWECRFYLFLKLLFSIPIYVCGTGIM